MQKDIGLGKKYISVRDHVVNTTYHKTLCQMSGFGRRHKGWPGSTEETVKYFCPKCLSSIVNIWLRNNKKEDVDHEIMNLLLRAEIRRLGKQEMRPQRVSKLLIKCMWTSWFYQEIAEHLSTTQKTGDLWTRAMSAACKERGPWPWNLNPKIIDALIRDAVNFGPLFRMTIEQRNRETANRIIKGLGTENLGAVLRRSSFLHASDLARMISLVDDLDPKIVNIFINETKFRGPRFSKIVASMPGITDPWSPNADQKSLPWIPRRPHFVHRGEKESLCRRSTNMDLPGPWPGYKDLRLGNWCDECATKVAISWANRKRGGTPKPLIPVLAHQVPKIVSEPSLLRVLESLSHDPFFWVIASRFSARCPLRFKEAWSDAMILACRNIGPWPESLDAMILRINDTRRAGPLISVPLFAGNRDLVRRTLIQWHECGILERIIQETVDQRLVGRGAELTLQAIINAGDQWPMPPRIRELLKQGAKNPHLDDRIRSRMIKALQNMTPDNKIKRVGAFGV